ncbi:MAG: hypothetical protein SNJ72_10590 [Fimbriimonadales bacterium]
MMNQHTKTEKVRINDTEYEITLLPILPETDNTTATPNPAIVPPREPQEVIREAPALTELPRWEDGASF